MLDWRSSRLVYLGWSTDEFKFMRRHYLTHIHAADAVRGRVLQLILGYIGLLMFMGFLFAAFLYIFKQERLEKLQAYKTERDKKRTISKDRLTKKKKGTKQIVLLCFSICVVLLFQASWLYSSSEYGCAGEKALEGMKTDLIDGIDNSTVASLTTHLEEKDASTVEKGVPYVFNATLVLHTKAKMESTTREHVKLEYNIHTKDKGGSEHLIYSHKTVLTLSDTLMTAKGKEVKTPFENTLVLSNTAVSHYTGDAILEIRASDCRHRYISKFLLHIKHQK